MFIKTYNFKSIKEIIDENYFVARSILYVLTIALKMVVMFNYDYGVMMLRYNWTLNNVTLQEYHIMNPR